MKIGLISDTHGDLDGRVKELLSDVDEVWHAGDIGTLSVLEELEEWKPTRAVFGNIDDNIIRSATKEFNRFFVEGVEVLMTHIAGKPGKYSFPLANELKENGAPDLLVCGHSHIALVKYDTTKKMLWLNPGACGYKGFHAIRTILRFEIIEGRPQNMELIELGKRSKK